MSKQQIPPESQLGLGGRLFKAIWPDNVSNFAAIIVAITASILGLLDIVDLKKLIATTLSILALLAFSLIRDRISRDTLIATLRTVIEANRTLPADRFFSRQTPEKNILQDAHHSAYLIQETGSLVSEQCQEEISRILKSNGIVKFIVCLPSSFSTKNLAYRNENLDTSIAILNRLDSFHNQIRAIKRTVPLNSINLQVRYTPYDVGFTLVMSNAESQLSQKNALVRLAGFRVPYNSKLDFTFDSRQSPSTIRHFVNEFEELFESSTKIVALTAEPRFGKTKMFQDLIANPTGRDDIYYVLSVREYGDGNQISFAGYSSENPSLKRTFARKMDTANYPERDIRQYNIDASIWDHFAGEIEEARKKMKLIVIDEIGEMQLQSKAFCDVIREILNSPAVSLFATILLDDARHPLLKEIKEHHRTSVFQVNSENQTAIGEKLRAEFLQAARLQDYIKNGG